MKRCRVSHIYKATEYSDVEARDKDEAVMLSVEQDRISCQDLEYIDCNVVELEVDDNEKT